MLSSFTRPQAVPNLSEFLSSVEHKRGDLVWYDILQNIFFCVQQKKRNSYRFGTTWGWV